MKNFQPLDSSPKGSQTVPKAKANPEPVERQLLPFEVVIMAGGRGERLKPLTDKAPKPMLDVGGKPIVEYNVRRLIKTGVREFTFCLNYLGKMVEDHFGDGKDYGASISYLYEERPLGTIGGLMLKDEFKYQDLLVLNGDLLTAINFEKFYTFFLENDADMAVAAIPYNVNLAYGILEIGNDHEVKSVREKPTFTYHINTGIYFIRRELTELIPKGKPFDAIELIEIAMEKGCKVSTFPLLDYWIDIGQMEDYEKARKDIEFLDL